MKNTIHPVRNLVASLCLLALAPLSQSAVIQTWNDYTATTGSSATTLTSTESVALAVGDTLTFSGNFSFASESGTGDGSLFRWALFDNNGSATASNWSGYLVGGTTAASSSSALLYEKTAGSGSWTSLSSYNRVDSNDITGGTSNRVALNAGNYSFSLSITRLDNDSINITWSLVGTGENTKAYSLAGTYIDTSVITYTYNRVAIQLTSTFGQSSAGFSNLSLAKTSNIPEPSTLALLFGLSVVLIAFGLRVNKSKS